MNKYQFEKVPAEGKDAGNKEYWTLSGKKDSKDGKRIAALRESFGNGSIPAEFSRALLDVLCNGGELTLPSGVSILAVTPEGHVAIPAPEAPVVPEAPAA